ncbi:protein TolB [Wolbachia endosymbiont of Chironomus riparius]|uniref:protein TolB n=1 Tax=Wolbachia endosymbiont of Chironomus riparius TaxID=2883238 RepID=UPI00209C90CF|nr:protein TolB [Wolbachia endosymbiont of Chironomus riparius]
MQVFISTILFILVPIFCLAQNVLYVDIRQNSTDHINVVVSSGICKTEWERKLSADITKIIETNLSKLGPFNVKRELANNSTSGDVLAIINLNEIQNNKLQMSFSLFDTLIKRELINKSMIISEKDGKQVGHSISDLICDRLIGEKGHFRTKITYIAEERDENNKSVRKVAIMNQDGSNIKYLTNGDKFVSTPRFSPNGKSIVYVSYENGRSYLILIDLIDSTESVISIFEGVISAPRFSPNGKYVVASHSINGKTNILSLDLNGKRISKITKSLAINTSPSLSPDQNYVVFSSDISGSQQLYIIDLTKKEKKPTRISFGNGRYATPVWSPKGDLIAFTKVQSGKFYIGVMKPNGKEEFILSEGNKIESPAWLPNGKEIIFTKTESNNSSKLYLIDLIKKEHKVVFTPTNAYLPDWSYL